MFYVSWTRTKRLFVPSLLVILVVVVPQAWLQLVESGEVSVCSLSIQAI